MRKGRVQAVRLLETVAELAFLEGPNKANVFTKCWIAVGGSNYREVRWLKVWWSAVLFQLEDFGGEMSVGGERFEEGTAYLVMTFRLEREGRMP